MNQYIATLKLNHEADTRKIESLLKELKMQPTNLTASNIKVFIFESEINNYYHKKKILESERISHYFELLDIGKASAFDLKALTEQKQSEPEWLVPKWFTQSVSELASLFNWETRQYQTAVNYGKGKESEHKYQILPLKIAGQNYELRLIHKPKAEDSENTYSFELHNKQPGGRIPGGFKLRLLTIEGEGWSGNEAMAQTARDYLQVKVELDPGDEIIWETEPLPNDYYPVPLQF